MAITAYACTGAAGSATQAEGILTATASIDTARLSIGCLSIVEEGEHAAWAGAVRRSEGMAIWTEIGAIAEVLRRAAWNCLLNTCIVYELIVRTVANTALGLCGLSTINALRSAEHDEC